MSATTRGVLLAFDRFTTSSSPLRGIVQTKRDLTQPVDTFLEQFLKLRSATTREASCNALLNRKAQALPRPVIKNRTCRGRVRYALTGTLEESSAETACIFFFPSLTVWPGTGDLRLTLRSSLDTNTPRKTNKIIHAPRMNGRRLSVEW